MTTLVACSSAPGSTTGTLATVTLGTGTSANGTSAATADPPTTTTRPANSIGLDLVGSLPVEVFGPREVGDYPVVVMVHGGGWFGGSPVSMEPLADYLASRDIVVFNSTYRTSGGGYPESFEDVACDISYALTKAPDYTTSTGPLAVVAHSAGAHIASVVSLAGDQFRGACSVGATIRVDRFVGLAGPYDPTLYSAVLAGFFGTKLEVDSAPWDAGSPYSYLSDNPEIALLLVHGTDDDLVPLRSSELFSEAATGAGLDATLVELPGASHMDARSPNVVGDLIADFVTAP